MTPHSIPTETVTKIHEDARNSPFPLKNGWINSGNMAKESLNISEIESIIVDNTTMLDNSISNDNSETTAFNDNAAQSEAERR